MKNIITLIYIISNKENLFKSKPTHTIKDKHKENNIHGIRNIILFYCGHKHIQITHIVYTQPRRWSQQADRLGSFPSCITAQ
jgi:hypothetical protein